MANGKRSLSGAGDEKRGKVQDDKFIPGSNPGPTLDLGPGLGVFQQTLLAQPVQAHLDARAQRIYGSTKEIMNEVIRRSLGLGEKRNRQQTPVRVSSPVH